MRTRFTSLSCTLLAGLTGVVFLQGPPGLAEATRPNVVHQRQRAVTPEKRPLAKAVSKPTAVKPKPKPKAKALPAYDPLILASIREFNSDLPLPKAVKLAVLIEDTAKKHKVDPYLIVALVSQESAFRQTAVSRVGARGLGQLMPETAKELGVNPHKAEENLDGCVRYLAQHLKGWSHTRDPVALALASYNAGAGNVRHYGGIPPFQETRHYVKVIKRRYATLRGGRALSALG